MKRLSAFIGLVLLCGFGSVGELAAQDLLIRNARIVDANRVIERGNIVVRNGRIESVGVGATAEGLTEIDGTGMTAMPGFIDGHRHIIGGDADQWFAQDAVVEMQQFLDAGYTTLMEGGGRPPGITELKRRIESGELVGPRVITSARANSNDTTPDEARAQVRAASEAGVDIIKTSIDLSPAGTERETLAAIVDEAHQVGLEVMAHAVRVPEMIAAVEAGVDKLVHTPHDSFMTPEQAQMVADSGIENLSTIGFAVPLFDVFNDDNVPTFRNGQPWPDSIIATGSNAAGEKAVNARTLWDAGVVYGYGTDTGYLPKDGLKHELRSLNLMFSPLDLLTLMGPNSAAFVNMEDDIGTLDPGKLADIVLLGGDPLDGYWNYLDVKLTIKEGVIVSDQR
jgi:imidazolonepropionase-like amidohydrolase